MTKFKAQKNGFDTVVISNECEKSYKISQSLMLFRNDKLWCLVSETTNYKKENKPVIARRRETDEAIP